MHKNSVADFVETTGRRPIASLRSLRLMGIRSISTAVLISFSAVAHAALIEIPDYHPAERSSAGNGRQSLLSLHSGVHRSFLSGYGILPVASDGHSRSNDLALHLVHAPSSGIKAHGLRLEETIGSASDLYAAIDAPYGSITSSMPANNSDPDLWTVFLVAAGLIGYQIRRKYKVAAIRIRPLQSGWQRSAG